MLLLRTGLVSFGQGLYYCVGAYAAGSLGQFFAITDALAMLARRRTLAAAVLALRAGLPARALSKHLFRDALARLLDDPVRLAGENLGAREHRRVQHRGAAVVRAADHRRAQASIRCLRWPRSPHSSRAGASTRYFAHAARPARTGDQGQRDSRRVSGRLGAQRDPRQLCDRRRRSRVSAAR